MKKFIKHSMFANFNFYHEIQVLNFNYEENVVVHDILV